MADHIAAMLDVKRQIEDAGERLEDLHLARAMILSLPKTQSWDIIKIQLFDVEPTKLTVDVVSGTRSYVCSKNQNLQDSPFETERNANGDGCTLLG